MNEHDDLFLSVSREEPLTQILEKAKQLGWSSNELKELEAYTHANALMAKNEMNSAKSILAELLRVTGNYYIGYYSKIFLDVCLAGDKGHDGVDSHLSVAAEHLLTELANKYGSRADQGPYNAVNWILLAVRLNLALVYGNAPGIEWRNIKSSTLAMVGLAQDFPTTLVDKNDIALFVSMLSRSEDNDLSTLGLETSRRWGVDLAAFHGVFP